MSALLSSHLQTRLLTEEAQFALLPLTPDAFDLPRGTLLQNGAFVLEEVLGRGGFGITYRARDCRDGHTVAIKEYFPVSCIRLSNRVQPHGSASDTSARESGFAATRFLEGKRQFLEEARILMGLRHPNIVRVQSAFEQNATAYLVMEHLEGQTLLERVDESGPLKPDEAVAIIEKVAGALQAVHHLGMLHLDIKPENVFLCDPRRSPGSVAAIANDAAFVSESMTDVEEASAMNRARRVVLMDFDLMRRVEGAATYQTRPLSHTFHCGTPGYAPLEQYTQGARFGTHTDIYALGATAFHLLTGHAPHAATDRAHREWTRGTSQETPHDSELLRHIEGPVRQAVAWAMQIKPDQRPQTVSQFLDALRGHTLPAIKAPHMSTHAAASTATSSVASSGAALPQAAGSTATSSLAPASLPTSSSNLASNSARVAPSHSASHTSIVSGEWHHVRLATAECEWPLFCACCGAAGDSFFTVAAIDKANRGRGKSGRTWQVPYCRTCLRHVRAAKNAVSVAISGMGCGLCLATVSIATSNLYAGALGVFVHFTAMAYWVLKHVFAEQTATTRCCDTREAVACAASGRAMQWKFKNADYALAFRQLNAGAVI